MQRKYQLLVYWASGFTGRLCAKYLHENYPEVIKTYNWAKGYIRNIIVLPNIWKKKAPRKSTSIPETIQKSLIGYSP